MSSSRAREAERSGGLPHRSPAFSPPLPPDAASRAAATPRSDLPGRPDPAGLPESHYRLLFESAPAPYLVLRAEPPFVIVDVNEAYLRATHAARERLIGAALFEAFPGNPGDPAADGPAMLRASLERVLRTREPDAMSFQRYDIRRPEAQGGGFEERHWSPVNVPVFSPAGEMLYIVHRVEDVTPFVRLVEAGHRERGRSDDLQARNDEMAAELLRRSAQLERLNSELQRKNEALSGLAQRIQLDARRKDEFLAMLAHELRNPLAAIHNALRLLERQPGTAEARRYLDVLGRQTRTLTGLMDELLDVSRITHGLVALRRERVEFAPVIERALDGVQVLLDEKRHEVSVTLPRRSVEVLGDPVRLEQVLANLVTNAAKYTDPGGRIALSLEVRDERAELRVRDTGIGMTPEELGQVFTLFSQSARGLDRAQGGLGIGLTIVQRLVELHGGDIRASSEGPGRGSEFVLTLPLLRVEQDRPQGLVAPGTATGSGAGRPRGRRRILVVDDGVDIAETLALLLTAFGHAVEVAHDGPGAIAKAQAQAPELVLIDIGLPGMDGYELARQLRRAPRTRHAVLAALTGYGQASDRERALAAGFAQHFVKPVDLEALAAFVEGAQVPA